MIWASLLLGVSLLTLLTLGFGVLVLPEGECIEQLLAGALLTTTVIVVGVACLGAIGSMNTAAMVLILVATAIAVVTAVRLRRAPWRLRWRTLVSLGSTPMLLAAFAAFLLAMLAAYYLPVWQWDALAYHLPYVNLVLQNGTFADVPADVPFLSTYPHNVELAFISWRTLLPDDELIDLAQVPFGVLGTLAVATTACRQGARPDYALAAGAAWLTIPAVFLQLATNYVDVASAALLLTAIAFLLSPADRPRLVLAAIAIGLFLGSKPQAPIGAAILLAVLTVLAVRAGLFVMAPVGWIIATLLGGHSYLINAIRHGNPLWPVRLDAGPLHLSGKMTMSDLLDAGAPRHGSAVARVAESWTTLIPAEPIFDMRSGGLGLVFLVALPFAAVRAVRTRSLTVAACVAATLATPEPSVARYVLGFAGLTLAFAIAVIESPQMRDAWRVIALVTLASAAASDLWMAYPGLAAGGPKLADYPSMTQLDRQRAVGAAGRAGDYRDVLTHVGAGEVTVLDSTAEFPYMAWPFDLSRRAVMLPEDVDLATAERKIMASNVAVLFVGDETPGGSVAKRHPERFEPQFPCDTGNAPCTVYLRR